MGDGYRLAVIGELMKTERGVGVNFEDGSVEGVGGDDHVDTTNGKLK